MLRLFIVVSLLLAGSACSDFAGTLRKATYPPDFKYVSEQELRSGMQQLAFQMQSLDNALADEVIDQQQVTTVLRKMEQIGGTLKAGEAGSNHPFLQDYMSDFVSTVSKARIAASLNPPRYYEAGRISGGCTNCHKVNR